MTDLQLAAVALAAMAMAGAVVAAWLWNKLRSAHRRLHDLQAASMQTEQQIADLSRALATTKAHSLTAPSNCEIACHSQHGEELFLWQRCEFKTDGVFVEIGAYDGVGLSNSLFFERLGWNGVLVEAHPGLAASCRINRPLSQVVHAALGAVDGGSETFSMVSGPGGVDTLSFMAESASHRERIAAEGGTIRTVSVPRRTLQSVLDEIGITRVDWMSIDVEGAELLVLRGASFDRWKPTVIMVEDNSGGRDHQVADVLAANGYRRDLRIGCNDIYVRSANLDPLAVGGSGP